MFITKGNTTYDGIIEIDGQFACEKCKTINPSGKLIMHIDFTDKYISNYECETCGNAISTETMRSWGDTAYYDD